MRRAIEVVRSKGSVPSTSPRGCVVVLDRREIARERKQMLELPQVEMVTVRRAREGIGKLELR